MSRKNNQKRKDKMNNINSNINTKINNDQKQMRCKICLKLVERWRDCIWSGLHIKYTGPSWRFFVDDYQLQHQAEYYHWERQYQEEERGWLNYQEEIYDEKVAAE
jgi:hypothetical protein